MPPRSEYVRPLERESTGGDGNEQLGRSPVVVPVVHVGTGLGPPATEPRKDGHRELMRGDLQARRDELYARWWLLVLEPSGTVSTHK